MDFGFFYPPHTAKQTKVQDVFQDMIVSLDLGPTIKVSTQDNVPKNLLTVDFISQKDDRIKDGCYYDYGWQSDKVPENLRTIHFVLGDMPFCLTKFYEAAYDQNNVIHSYSVSIDGGFVIFDFETFLSFCGTDEDPEDNCVIYNEKRDTADFLTILSSLHINKITE